jgi:hypothetical protein
VIDQQPWTSAGEKPTPEDSVMKKMLFPILGTLVVGLCIASVVRAEEVRGGTVKDGGGQPQEATTVKSSKSNSSDRLGGTGGGSPAEATTVKSSKSNSSERLGGTGGGSPAEATTVKGSKSNSDN